MKNLFDKVHDYYGQPYNKPLLNHLKITDYLKQWSQKNLDQNFIVNVRLNGKTDTITYKECYHLVNKICLELKQNYHIDSYDKVALIPRNSINSILIVLALIEMDITIVMLNSSEPVKKIKEQLKTVDCNMVIADDYFTEELVFYEVDKIVQDATTNAVVTNEASKIVDLYRPSILLFTTGTTSASKAVAQSNYNIVNNCYALLKHHKLNNNSRLMCVLPIYYANGLEFTIFTTLMAGSTVILCEEFDPFSFAKIISEQEINISSVVPSILKSLLDTKIKFKDHFQYFVSAAAPLPSQIADQVYTKWERKIIQGYGLTETTNFSLKTPVDIDTASYEKYLINTDIPSVGCELFGNQIAIIGADGEILPDGETGEVVMRGHNVMLNYYGNEEATSAAFNNGWFHSGDLGRFTSHSMEERYLVLTGRLKNIIKSGGLLISLEDVDRFLLQHPSIEDAVSCAVEDEYLGEALISIIVLKDSMDEHQIMHYLSSFFAKNKLPKRIFIVDKIPKSKNGKVNRNQLANSFK